MAKPAHYPHNPEHLWDIFYKLSRVPRPSKKEEKARDFLVSIAKDHHLDYKVDAVGNVVIYLAPSQGYEKHPSVVIQNHIDMVCDATPGHAINFETDPIELQVKDGWLSAKGTTLGADNGIGCAAALALIFDKTVKHPPLELLFTMDEETGLYGAKGLDATVITSRKMINLDTEEWGSLYIGCAGGFDYNLKHALTWIDNPHKNYKSYQLKLSGLKGGHSGVDIHRRRGNAIKILSEVLKEIQDDHFEIYGFESGRAHNIIPRDAVVMLTLSEMTAQKLEEVIEKKLAHFKGYLAKEDSDLNITLTEESVLPKKVIATNEKRDLLDLLTLFPHGAYRYHFDGEPVVSVSSNLAIVKISEHEVFMQTSVRFFDPHECREVEQKIETLARNYKYECKRAVGYPSWTPIWEGNALLELAKKEYKHLFKETPKIKAIHAGLECGIIKERLGEMEIISFGPTITGAHSPTESIEINSVESFWNLFVAILAKL